MTSVLLLESPDTHAPDLRADFASAGFTLSAQGECAHLVREALRNQPDVVVCWAPRADDDLLKAVATLQKEQPMPVVVFTRENDVALMQRALEAGVHAWVVQGYGAHRLRPLIAMARARHAHDRALRERVAELESRLEERKLVDKAKGILMRARQLSEEEAFRLLRKASMQGNQKVGQVSQQVIDAARVGEAINRAGQQRMLSQRLVKLYALACSRTDGQAAALLMRETVTRIEDNLAALASELSPDTFGDLLEAGKAAWKALKAGLETTPRASALPQLDAWAEAVLANAEALALALESSGLASPVGVVNVAGRQRMLSQRMAKLLLLRVVAADPAATQREIDATAAAFEQGFKTLNDAPLSTPEIRAMLADGDVAWQALLACAPQADQAAGRLKLAAVSEDLFAIFDRLTAVYQHSVQVLLGDSA
ncbi:MAG TPA: type IV pili methyl-accepting chemotaxis transducer N-terminal domain-containing protein [Ramlibacter sp.]|nr:type IV pili methyl-accepting chemotaxis transducer N-terminal domain-containing protein [Ramlibacter sp.]